MLCTGGPLPEPCLRKLPTCGAFPAIPIRMAFDPDKAKKSFRRLHKSLKAIPKLPSPEQVHALRTRTRRVEAVVHALKLDHQGIGKGLLKAIAPICKKAGKVRDMDVLIGFATTLPKDGVDDCLVQLIEQLGSRRVRSVRKLRNILSAQRKEVRLRLKKCSAFVDNRAAVSRKPHKANRELSADATATALNVWAELSEWPRLNTSNLHPFRLKVKELRYILQLGEDDGGKFVDTLGEVKDAIGEWHDWNELAAIAAVALSHGTQCALI